MGVQVLDDGSTLVTDSNGDVVGGTDNQGNAIRTFGAGGSGVVQQFANLLDYGVKAAINSRYGLVNAQPQAGLVAQQQQRSQANVSMIVGVGLVVVAAAVAYKILKG